METGQEVNYAKFNLNSQLQISSPQLLCLAPSDWKNVRFQKVLVCASLFDSQAEQRKVELSFWVTDEPWMVKYINSWTQAWNMFIRIDR